jgi:hypothetical protein
MNPTPKTIQIFLPGGDPQGIRVAEISTRMGRSANSWLEWKSKDGKTLDALKRQAPLG